MKKHLLMVLSLFMAADGMLVGGELCSIFVYNQDLTLESNGAPLYWKAFNRVWPCEIQSGQDADGSRFVSLRPLPSPTQKNSTGAPRKQGLVRQGTRFLGGRGQKVRIGFQFRIHDAASGVLNTYCQVQGTVSRGGITSFMQLKNFRPEPGKWTRYSCEKKLSDRLLPEEECYLSFCISGDRVDIKDLKIELESIKLQNQ